jgi:hypothetical protein
MKKISLRIIIYGEEGAQVLSRDNGPMSIVLKKI